MSIKLNSQQQPQYLIQGQPQRNPGAQTVKSHNANIPQKKQVINTKVKHNKAAYYLKKPRNEQRRIIQKPWSKPMAAQHLAAVRIQSLVRRFLYRKRKSERRHPTNMQRISKKQVSAPINKQRMAQHHKVSNVSEMQHFTANQKLRSKFFTSPFNVLHRSEDQCWKNFCAALIQATYKMALTRRLFKYHRFAMYHIAAIQIQWAWRGFLERRKQVPQKSKEQIATEKIQRAWRSFTNIKIFKYYKDLINFKEKGDPAQLLKSVNPGEAGILDSAAKCHIRFRLGGDKFPPLIYYKIFIHGSIVDINAFAPRDYMKIKKEKKKQIINIKFDKNPNDKHDGWYERHENNGWRPISDKILTPYDAVELRTANKPKKFHFDKQKRKELTAQEKRVKKLKWLRKLYKDAKNAEILGEQPNILDEHKDQKALENLYDNPFDDKRFLQLKDREFESEVNNLIEWCEDLDYEKYIGNWHQLATSAYSGSAQEKLNLAGQTAALNTGSANFLMRGLDDQIGTFGEEGEATMQDDQNRYSNAFQSQQEQFLQQNADYENRLKEHMYQFDENKSGMMSQKGKGNNITAGAASMGIQ